MLTLLEPLGNLCCGLPFCAICHFVDTHLLDSAIPSSWKQNRVARDGPHFHVTLVSHLDSTLPF
jgi:hypothetical protein